MKNISKWLLIFFILMSLSIQSAWSQDVDLGLLEMLGFRVGGVQTLQDVISRLGVANTWSNGDASNAESKICYRIPGTRGDTVVVFASNGEMASPDGQVNHIQVIGPNGIFPERQNCSLLHSSVSQLKTPSGLHLGMSLAEVYAVYGKKSPLKNGSVQYSSCKRRYFLESDPYFKKWVGKTGCFEDPARPYYDDCGVVQVGFKNGHAISISISMNQSVC